MRWLGWLLNGPNDLDRDLARAEAQINRMARARARDRRRESRVNAAGAAPFLGVSNRRSYASLRRTQRGRR